MTLKVSNPSLGYLASYARIAIQISKISRELEKWRSAREIKLRAGGELGYESYRSWPPKAGRRPLEVTLSPGTQTACRRILTKLT